MTATASSGGTPEPRPNAVGDTTDGTTSQPTGPSGVPDGTTPPALVPPPPSRPPDVPPQPSSDPDAGSGDDDDLRTVLPEALGVPAGSSRRKRRLWLWVTVLSAVLGALGGTLLAYLMIGPSVFKGNDSNKEYDADQPPFTVSVRPEQSEPREWAMVLDRVLTDGEVQKMQSLKGSSDVFSYLKSLGGRPLAYAPLLEHAPKKYIEEQIAGGRLELSDTFRMTVLSARQYSVTINDWEVTDLTCRESTAQTVVALPPQGGVAYEGIRLHLPPRADEPVRTDDDEGQGEPYFTAGFIEVGNGQSSGGLRAEVIAPPRAVVRVGNQGPLQRHPRAGRALGPAEGRQGRAAPRPYGFRPGEPPAELGLRVRPLDAVPRQARGGDVLPALTGRVAVLVAVLAVLCVPGCSSDPSSEEKGPEPGPSAPYRGNRGYALPDSPFTREGTVVTATCSMGARYAGVSVQAWDAQRWELRETRNFFIPVDAAFTNYPGAKEVNSPLVDLCGAGPDSPSPYAVDDLAYVTPRVRALFDLAFTRMAVVLRDPGDGRTSHVGFVESGGNADDFVRLGDTAGADEQNAVMAPDGRAVWFTYRASTDGEYRIGSRSVKGDHRLSDEGPATGHELPLTVSGKPAHAVQANMVRLAPGGRRLTGTVPKIFGNVFGTLDSSGPLTEASARSAVLLSGCVGIVGWVDDERVFCRDQSGSFRTVDARSGRAEGATVAVVREGDGMVAEGMVVSADGERFIASVHLPNDRSGERGGRADFRVVSTSGEGPATPVSHPSLSNGTVFLEWW